MAYAYFYLHLIAQSFTLSRYSSKACDGPGKKKIQHSWSEIQVNKAIVTGSVLVWPGQLHSLPWS